MRTGSPTKKDMAKKELFGLLNNPHSHRPSSPLKQNKLSKMKFLNNDDNTCRGGNSVKLQKSILDSGTSI
jgi:hypothetical protein